MTTVSWDELGQPKVAGDVRVEGLGIVKVTESNIQRANEVGGNPSFELHDATTMEDQIQRYLLGLMV